MHGSTRYNKQTNRPRCCYSNWHKERSVDYEKTLERLLSNQDISRSFHKRKNEVRQEMKSRPLATLKSRGNSTYHHMLVLVLHRTITYVYFCIEHHILLKHLHKTHNLSVIINSFNGQLISIVDWIDMFGAVSHDTMLLCLAVENKILSKFLVEFHEINGFLWQARKYGFISKFQTNLNLTKTLLFKKMYVMFISKTWV
jgi:hypothetical protein